MGHLGYDNRQQQPKPMQGYSSINSMQGMHMQNMQQNVQGYNQGNNGMYRGAANVTPQVNPAAAYNQGAGNQAAKQQGGPPGELAEMKTQMNDAVERYKQLSDTMQRLATMMSDPAPAPPPRQDSAMFWTACAVMGAAVAVSMVSIAYNVGSSRR